MIRIGVLGGGNHSRGNHLPALERYRDSHPGAIQLAAFCDRDPEVASQVSGAYQFKSTHTDIESMLADGGLDGIVAVTPIAGTAAAAKRIIEAGIPLLMEKPMGASWREACGIHTLAEERSARVMVSMNRRFDPSLLRLRTWRDDHSIHHIHARMLRKNRTESFFFTGTAIYLLDTVRHLAGDVVDYSFQHRLVNGVPWYWVDLRFGGDITARLDVMPTCGVVAETYEVFSDGESAKARSGFLDRGEFTVWRDGKVLETVTAEPDTPNFISNGACGETEEFITSIHEGRTPFPTPADVLQSMEICHRIEEEARAAVG